MPSLDKTFARSAPLPPLLPVSFFPFFCGNFPPSRKNIIFVVVKKVRLDKPFARSAPLPPLLPVSFFPFFFGNFSPSRKKLLS